MQLSATSTGADARKRPAALDEGENVKLYGLDPERYLREVLTRIANHPINRIGDLLPWNLTKTA